MSDSFNRVRSYVIRAARMSDAQKKAYEELSDHWLIPDNGEFFDWNRYFPDSHRRIIEIGFGMGDATRKMAKEKLDWGILGIEVHKPGVGKLLWWIEQEQIENIRIVEADAVDVLAERIPRESVDGIHIWFPDPWPKKRHHKRRLIQPAFVRQLAGTLRIGGYVHAATDWEPYAEHILKVFEEIPGLQNRYERWAEKPEYRPDTKFENRGIAAERVIRDIIFEKEKI